MNRDQGIELAVVLLCLTLYLAYHFWLFFGRDLLTVLLRRKTRHAVVYSASRDVRLIWTAVVSQDKTESGVPAVQTLRNSIMAASFMATTCGLMATSGLLPVLTDASRLAQIRNLGDLDPMVDHAGSNGVVNPAWKIAICEFILLMSLLFFVQSIRLWSFLSYFIRLQSSDHPRRSAFSMELTLAIARRSGHCWSLGVRTFYLVIPALMWIMGPTTLLVVTVVLVTFLYITDEVSIRDFSSITGDGKESEEGRADGLDDQQEVAGRSHA